MTRNLWTTASDDLKKNITLHTCWKITSKVRNTVFAFTDHDTDITVSGLVYKASSGIVGGDVDANVRMGVKSSQILGLLKDNGIKELDILNGIYDSADIQIFKVVNNDTSKIIQVASGLIGNVELRHGTFTANIEDLTSLLHKTISQTYSKRCRASFSDVRCGVNITSHQWTAVITAVTGASVTMLFGTNISGKRFVNGKAIFSAPPAGSTGTVHADLDGLEFNIATVRIDNNTTATFTFYDSYYVDPIVGNFCYVQEGCDKSIETCSTYYNNVVNFRGEPYIPDKTTAYKRYKNGI